MRVLGEVGRWFRLGRVLAVAVLAVGVLGVVASAPASADVNTSTAYEVAAHPRATILACYRNRYERGDGGAGDPKAPCVWRVQRLINAVTGWGIHEDGIYGTQTANAVYALTHLEWRPPVYWTSWNFWEAACNPTHVRVKDPTHHARHREESGCRGGW